MLVMPSDTTVADAVIKGGTLRIAQGSTITKLAMTGGKIEVPIVGQVSDTTILTITELAEGTTLTTDNFAYPASVTLTLDTTTTPGSVLVKASRAVQNYVWTGASGTAFESLGNWLVDDAIPTEAPYPTIDTIEFPAEGAPWTVELAEDATIATVAVNGAVTIKGAKLLANAFTGTAAITLGGNAGIGDFAPSASMTISNPIAVSGTGNSLNALTKQVTYSGAISSTANATAGLALNGEVEMLILTGKNSGFYGTATMDGHVSLQSNDAGSANAKWVINNTTGDYDNPVKSDMTVYFGELSGTYTHVKASNNRYKNTLHIGALGTSFSLGGKFSDNNSDRAETIYKEGSGTMTFSGRYVDTFFLNSGTVYVTSTDGTVVHNGIVFKGGTLKLANGVTQDFSGKVKSSTAAINVDIDSGVNVEWAASLDNTNTGGLTKKGAGTLTLSAEPKYTGDTAVEAGVLYIVDTYTPTLAAGTVEMVSDKTGYKKYVPAAAAVAHVGDVYYPTFAAAWAAAGSDENAAWVYLDAALAQDDVVTLDTAWQKVRVANGAYSAENNIAISDSLANVALKTSAGADMTEYTAYPTVAVTVTPGTGVASGVIADGYILKSGDNYTVYSGDTVTIVWTAEEGYVFEGGATTATTTVTPTEDVTPVCPTVSAIPSVSVSSVSATYGVDFTNATVTATLTGATAGQSYTMTVGGKSYTGEATAGGTVTFNDVAVTHSQADDTFTYEITSNDASVSGGNGSKAIVDEAEWFSTGADGSTEQTSGGSWSKTMTWTDGKTTFDEDGSTFTATDASSASKVEVKMSVCFGNANDEAINLGNANAAVKVATVNNALVFQALNNGEFVTLDGLTPTAEATYEVVLCFDYTTHKYTVTIGDTPLTYNESTELVMSSESTGIQSVAFKGVGSLASLAGTQTEGCVAMDAAGTRYLTLEAAMEAAANDSTKLPLTVLHDGTYNGATYAKGATGVPSGASIVAADQTTADAAAAKMSIALTSAQVQQGLKTAYYKAVAKEKTSGTYEVSFELADAVKPTVADEESTKAMETTTSAVALHVTNTKVGLYYGIAAGTSTTLGVKDAATLTKCTADGEDLGLTADLPESGVKYYKVIVSDSAQSGN